MRIYKRWTDSLFTFIGDIGGIMQIVLAFGVLVVTPFVKHSMNS
jgi:hypothetical protein